MSSPKPEDRNHSGKSEKMDLAPVAPESFRRSGFIERWRFWSPALLVIAFVLWRGADLWMQDFPGRNWHTPGHLAVAHGVYEDQCTVCHEAYSPVSASNWVAAGLGRTHAADSKCTQCHESANHHATENPDRRPACTACHLEHRGRSTSLVQTTDGQCTNCHANLNHNMAENATSKLSNVSRFDRDNHPEFQISQNTATDPRRLKFNHKLHLTAGMRTTAEGEAFTLKMVDPRYRSLYGADAGPGQAVRLECKSCHQLDSRDFAPAPDVLSDVPRNAVMPARPPGATMLPIVYEQHCRACHPLTFERQEGTDAAWQGAIVPHRQQPAQIRHFLEAFYLDRLQKSRPESLHQPFPPLPGKPPHPEQRILADVLSERVLRAEQQLYLGKKACGECHYSTPALEKVRPDRLHELRIQATQAPEVWFRKASFTHTPHRMLDCLACHAGADSRQELERPTTGFALQRAMLPGIDICLACHNASSPGGGARQDCVACHRYHDGDHPLTGQGAAARAGPHADTRSIRQFLDGSAP